MFLIKVQIATVVLLMMAVLVTGAGLLLSAQAPPAPAVARQPPPGSKDQAGTDRQGDPLPAGAVARLGTLRFRPEGFGVFTFLPDGRSFVTAGRQKIQFWEASTGRQAAPGSLQPSVGRGGDPPLGPGHRAPPEAD